MKYAVSIGLRLGMISVLRIFGLMVIVPILFNHIGDYGSTYGGLGFAIGIYGLCQALGQIPFGRLSDLIGRQEALTLGLLIFALGCVIAAFSHSLMGLIIGRALQGGAAVNGVVSAYAIDLVQEKERPVVLGVIGGMIGLMFFLAIGVAPFLDYYFGLVGIFKLTAFLSLCSIPWLWLMIPKPTQSCDAPAWDMTLFYDAQFLWCAGCAGLIHGVFTVTFSLLPSFLKQSTGQPSMDVIYGLSMLVAACVICVAMRKLTKAYHQQYHAVPWLLLVMGLCLLQLSQTMSIVLSLGLFIAVFGLLEAILPSILAYTVQSGTRGAIMGGFYAFAQLGVFIFSAFAGTMRNHVSTATVFLILGAVLITWGLGRKVWCFKYDTNYNL